MHWRVSSALAATSTPLTFTRVVLRRRGEQQLALLPRNIQLRCASSSVRYQADIFLIHLHAARCREEFQRHGLDHVVTAAHADATRDGTPSPLFQITFEFGALSTWTPFLSHEIHILRVWPGRCCGRRLPRPPRPRKSNSICSSSHQGATPCTFEAQQATVQPQNHYITTHTPGRSFLTAARWSHLHILSLH